MSPQASGSNLEYTYSLANASLTLRLMNFLSSKTEISLESVTVIHYIDRWIVRVRLKPTLSEQQEGNFRAFFNEIGFAVNPPMPVLLALQSLAKLTPVEVMNRYRVAIIAHGKPTGEEIEVFRRQFIQGLGYCPQHLI